MGFFHKEVELIIPPKKPNTNNKTIKVKSGYDAIRKKIDEGNTYTYCACVSYAPHIC